MESVNLRMRHLRTMYSLDVSRLLYSPVMEDRGKLRLDAVDGLIFSHLQLELKTVKHADRQ